MTKRMVNLLLYSMALWELFHFQPLCVLDSTSVFVLISIIGS